MVVVFTMVFPARGTERNSIHHSVERLINAYQLDWLNNFKDSHKTLAGRMQCNLGNNDMSHERDLSHNQEYNQSPPGLSLKKENPSWATTIHA